MEPPVVDPVSLKTHAASHPAGYDNHSYDDSDASKFVRVSDNVGHRTPQESVRASYKQDGDAVSLSRSTHDDGETGEKGSVDGRKPDTDSQMNEAAAHKDPLSEKFEHDPETAKSKFGPVQIISAAEEKIRNFFKVNRRILRIALYSILFCAYNAFLIYACVRDFSKAKKLFILTVVVYVCVIYFKFVSKPLWSRVAIYTKPLRKYLRQHRKNRKRIQVVLFFCAVIIFLGVDCAKSPRRLQSLTGIFGIILFGFLISKYPARVNWYTVVWGIAIQLIFGLIVLRWDAGRSVFVWMGDLVESIITFTDAGSEFVFGANFREHFFAFAVCPVIVFFGFLIAALYYLGVMQLHWEPLPANPLLLQRIYSSTEAPLMVRPYLDVMTKSELHALFVGGFANVAGSVLAAYISFGVSAVHLLSASIMSAPCSLALAKLVYPEVEPSKTGFDHVTAMDRGAEQNLLEAATVGAQQTVKLISYIVANLISCLAALKMFNFLLEYLGGLVGIHGLTFEFICGYIFVPLAWSMGCDWEDVTEVGSLVGTKTILNEFIAYTKLGELIKNRTITERSEVVATYALCGFSNITSLGITIGGMAAMAPARRSDIISVGFRSLVTGCLSCFMCASLASLLIDV
ncbi:solute carrier family 28 member 3-like isoform X2 [Paramacrobiotus metropolitanus]|uniref:solute carrier family 28 member 3-like isoform X2 n=1 Tax=Paramacrobiotus metropolitanus TaxID=2943436 RepID=UPI00244562A3|nr:solute carrier family 28 member 3-like isoform X2 [Paramacrobiotus metropolitanus]